MHYEELEEQIDFLMGAALRKSGSMQEAEELTQEVLLAALTFLSQGKTIENLRAWLLAALNHKFYDMIRKKYRQPVISIGGDFDIMYEEKALEEISESSEAEAVRKEVAYLAGIYREVVVRHYMNGESVADIAAALGIPEGTVKRRLYTGRDQIKKGISDMENYTKQSYEPVRLGIGNSGRSGINLEPGSLTHGDLVAQNLLWLAYQKPVTIDELSRAIGIPTAYVEPVVKKLVDGQLMKGIKNKFYTDFVIYTKEDREKYIPAQKQFVKENFDLFWGRVGEGLCKIREKEIYKRCNFDQRNSLEMYFAFKILEAGYGNAVQDIFQVKREFPERPNGGAWIAKGFLNWEDGGGKERSEFSAYLWSGERMAYFRDYGESRQIMLRVYGTEGFPSPTYNRCFDDIPTFRRNEQLDAVILKLLYILHAGLNPNQVGFQTEALKGIPHLVKCKVLRLENNKPVVNIPVLSVEEFMEFWKFCGETAYVAAGDMKGVLAEFLKGKKLSIPPHLDSVPLGEQYMPATDALLLSAIREAIRRGNLYDGDYDRESGENPPPCPMILVIEK